VIELGSMEAIKELVKIGLGAAARAVDAQAEIESGALVSLRWDRASSARRWAVAHLKGPPTCAGEETLWTLRFVTKCLLKDAGAVAESA